MKLKLYLPIAILLNAILAFGQGADTAGGAPRGVIRCGKRPHGLPVPALPVRKRLRPCVRASIRGRAATSAKDIVAVFSTMARLPFHTVPARSERPPVPRCRLELVNRFLALYCGGSEAGPGSGCVERISGGCGSCVKSKSAARSPSSGLASRTSGRESGLPSVAGSSRWPPRKSSSTPPTPSCCPSSPPTALPVREHNR